MTLQKGFHRHRRLLTVQMKLHAMFHKSNCTVNILNDVFLSVFLGDTEIDTTRGSFVRFCIGWFCLSVKRFLCCIKYFKYLYSIHYVSVWSLIRTDCLVSFVHKCQNSSYPEKFFILQSSGSRNIYNISAAKNTRR